MSFLRRQWPWVAFTAIVAALYLTSVSSEMGGNLGGDNIIYFLLGKAIASGDGYVDLYLPGNPPHHKYPFLFPLMLAPFHLLFDHPLLPMHVMVCLGWAASFLLFGLLLERRLGDRRAAIAIAALAAVIPRLYTQGTHLLSEAPFIAFCYAALLLADRPTAGPGRRRLAGLLALALCAYFTRTAAIALAGALLLTLWRDRSRVTVFRPLPAWLVFGVVFGAAVAGWWLFVNGGRNITYVGEFMAADPYDLSAGRLTVLTFVIRVIKNLVYNAPLLAMFSAPPIKLGENTQWWVMVGGGLGFVVIILGLVREFRRPRNALELFFLFSLAIILAWPFQEDRFLLPLVPLGVYYFLSATDWLVGRWWPARRAGVMIAVYALMFLVAAPKTAKFISIRTKEDLHPRSAVRVSGYGLWRAPVVNWSKYDWTYLGAEKPERDTLDSMTNYLVINAVLGAITPPDAIILSRKPMITYFFSGRKSLPILPNADPRFQWIYIQLNRVDYFITGLDESTMAPLFRLAPERFRLVAEINGGTKAFQVLDREHPLP